MVASIKPKSQPIVLSQAQSALFKQKLNRCWQTIAGDILRNMQEMGEEPIMPRADVVEVSIDQFESNGGMTRDEEKLWRQLSFEQKQALAEETFTHQRYGW
jgi:hypothetical protein